MKITGIFDSHGHYDHGQFDEDRDGLLQSMKSAGVDYILNSASDLESSKAAIALSEKYDFIYGSVGVHPHDASSMDDKVFAEIKQLASHPKVVAIGEMGLDFYYDYSPRDVQEQVFHKQLALAKELDMPVIIHSREACEKTLNIVRQYNPKGVVHCFSGSAQTAVEYVKLGMYIGLTGVVTFKNARKALEVAAAVPIDRLLIETDCPYMAPVPYRGKRSDSSMLNHVLEVLAPIKGVSPQELADITRENAFRAFEISVKA